MERAEPESWTRRDSAKQLDNEEKTWRGRDKENCQQLRNEGGKRGQNLEWQTKKDIAQGLKKKKRKRKAVDQIHEEGGVSEWWTRHCTAKGLEKEGGMQGQSLEEGGV